MNGGVDLLILCQEIEAKRNKILSQLSPNDKEKAKYILRIFDKISDEDFCFIHSMFSGAAVFLFLLMLGLGVLLSLPFSFIAGLLVHKLLLYYYYKKKANRLVKELDEKMNADSDLRAIFWKIRREGHYSDFKIANKIWRKIAT